MENSKIRVHYGEKVLEQELPAGWTLLGNLQTQHVSPISPDRQLQAFERPVGKPRLEEIAKGRKNAVIITTDHTRPTQGTSILPYLLNTLNRAGIRDQDIRVIMGGGSHQPPQDLQKTFLQKYGEEVVRRVRTAYHNPDEDCVSLGKTKRGHVVEINRWVVEADLKIGFGGILPHVIGGYSGGAKCVLPGVSSRETMIQNHVMVVQPTVGLGLVEGNPIRQEMEEVADMVGLDFLFNLVMNTEGQPVGAVAGDFRQAHREGVALARKIFQAELPRPAQVVFTSGYPFDIHFYQSLNGPCSVLNACVDGATIIHLTPAHEGIRSGTKKLFSTVRTLGYKNIFKRLEEGERTDESVRGFFLPEINIGVGTTFMRAMYDRGIRLVVVSGGMTPKELEEMGFGYAESMERAIASVHRRTPRAEVAAALNAKVIVTLAKA